ncbi:MAG TPA: hypothetical protein VFO61_03655 [Alphaproteobacteria bacterium]|nr:hypothetical protein [Alphaproteobacteria bacterium]
MSDTAPEKSAQASGPGASASAGAPGEDAVVLSLGDLLPDPHGDIVLLNDAGILSMAVVSDKAVVDTGVAEHHVTADGTDVAGMAYYSFEAGPTLYVPADMHFSLLPPVV